MATEKLVFTIADTAALADRIRLRVFDHVLKNNGGYMSQACSASEILAVLYTQIMKLNTSGGPRIPQPFPGVPRAGSKYDTGESYNGLRSPDSDVFVFSPAHYALVLYATLIETGRMAPEGLDQFNKDGSAVEMIGAEHSPGVATTTGSLGQAISQAGGIALGRRLLNETGRVWVLMTDGEFQEGQVWEAVSTLVHYRLDSVGIYVDMNNQQCDGVINDVMSLGDLREKLTSFGAKAVVVDGHDVESLRSPAREECDGRPLVVLARTNPTHKLSLMQERAPKLHYLRFTDEVEKQRYVQAYGRMKREIENGNR